MSVGARSQLSIAGGQGVFPTFGLYQTSSGGEHVLVLAGELDLASVSRLGEAVADLPMDHTTSVMLDLHELTFIDCAGISAIVAIQELCSKRRCGFSLVPGRAQVERLFELCERTDRLCFRNDDRRVSSDA
jgi:anti-sigma B factor antagonist